MHVDDLVPCDGCGALFQQRNGPTHRYIGASAGCWALYNHLLAGQMPSDDMLATCRVPGTPAIAMSAEDPGLGGLLIDAYAVQHHGLPSPQAVQSVAVHLLTLYGVCRKGQPADKALWVRLRTVRQKNIYCWLEPPPRNSALTIRHLFPGGGVISVTTVAAYVLSVLAAWEPTHKSMLEVWYERYVLAD